MIFKAQMFLMQHLWKPQKAKVLRQQGRVGEANAAPDGLVNGTEAKVHLSPVKPQIRRSHNGVDGETDSLHLRIQTQAASSAVVRLSLSECFCFSEDKLFAPSILWLLYCNYNFSFHIQSKIKHQQQSLCQFFNMNIGT